jgi:hypothetical protein
MSFRSSGSRLVPVLTAPLAASLTATAQVHPPASEPAAAPSGASRQTTVVIGLIVLLLMVVLVVLGTKKQA